MVCQGRQSGHQPGLYARCNPRDPGRSVRGLLELLHLWHGGRLDALLPVDREALVDARIQRFYVWWGVVGFFGLWLAGWLADRIGRRIAFITMLIEGAIFITLCVYTDSRILLWVFGLAWSFGFLGFWGPSTTLTAEVFPTRIRGAANGVVWAIAYFVGFVLWPFVTVALQQSTGSFALAFLFIPAMMIAMAAGIWLSVPEYAGKELDAIIV
jgi:MFS family permease